MGALDQADVFLSRAEAARHLGVSVDAFDGYRKRGLIRGWRVRGSRLVRFRLADVLGLLVPEPDADAESAAPQPRSTRDRQVPTVTL